MKKRIGMCVFGVLIRGISVGFFKRAAFGVDPFQTLMSGLDSCIPVSFGTLYVLANLVLLTFSLIADSDHLAAGLLGDLTLLLGDLPVVLRVGDDVLKTHLLLGEQLLRLADDEFRQAKLAGDFKRV